MFNVLDVAPECERLPSSEKMRLDAGLVSMFRSYLYVGETRKPDGYMNEMLNERIRCAHESLSALEAAAVSAAANSGAHIPLNA